MYQYIELDHRTGSFNFSEEATFPIPAIAQSECNILGLGDIPFSLHCVVIVAVIVVWGCV